MDAPPPARPDLRPALRWARWALVFLLAFTFLRGAVWSTTFPSFFGPDEDYHFLYAEYLTTQHALPSPDKPLYPMEYPELVKAMEYDKYGGLGPPEFKGDPKASVRKTARLPDSARDPVEVGRGVGIVHPPLYHVPAAVVNWSLGDASVFTRYHAVRWLTSLFGVLAVYAAWLLAAQVFRQESLRLLAAFLVAAQPMVALLAGIANHDSLVIATFTLATALMLFLLRTAPRARQGAWLGGAIALALLTKSSGLALLPLAALAYALQALAHRDRLREVTRSAGLAGLVVLVGAGWWYLYAAIKYGNVSATVPPAEPVPGTPAGIPDLWNYTKEWVSLTYKTYWYHHFWYEANPHARYFHVPLYAGYVAGAGLIVLVIRNRRRPLAADRPLLRQVVLMVLSALALFLPILALDLQHFVDGLGFSLSGGRYLLPAYPAVAVLMILGVRQLTPARLRPLVYAGAALLAAYFCWVVWLREYVNRYYGLPETGWGERLRNMTYDRPEFVTATTLRIAIALVFLSLLASAAAVVVGNLPPAARERLRRRARVAGTAAP